MNNAISTSTETLASYPLFVREGPAVRVVEYATRDRARAILAGAVDQRGGVPAVVSLLGTTRRVSDILGQDAFGLVLPECGDPAERQTGGGDLSPEQLARIYGEQGANDYTAAVVLRAGESYADALARKTASLGGPFSRLVGERLPGLEYWDFEPTDLHPFFERLYFLRVIPWDAMPDYPPPDYSTVSGASGSRRYHRVVPLTPDRYQTLVGSSGADGGPVPTVTLPRPKAGFVRAIETIRSHFSEPDPVERIGSDFPWTRR